ncbi:hypothetical protein RRG08_057405 [Elysia crispata]|uniref:Uncharacterized protein n=1 Tax=Elysia crispata TaxID=231223 RepID=A0AAE1B3L4_9GAST|nr:hypothetical protein RRG08_057405 [Elysia crispata]
MEIMSWCVDTASWWTARRQSVSTRGQDKQCKLYLVFVSSSQRLFLGKPVLEKLLESGDFLLHAEQMSHRDLCFIFSRDCAGQRVVFDVKIYFFGKKPTQGIRAANQVIDLSHRNVKIKNNTQVSSRDPSQQPIPKSAADTPKKMLKMTNQMIHRACQLEPVGRKPFWPDTVKKSGHFDGSSIIATSATLSA